MQAKLLFNLEDHDEKQEFLWATHGSDFAHIFRELLEEYLRDRIRNKSDQYSEEQEEWAREVSKYIIGLFEERGLDVNVIY